MFLSKTKKNQFLDQWWGFNHCPLPQKHLLDLVTEFFHQIFSIAQIGDQIF